MSTEDNAATEDAVVQHVDEQGHDDNSDNRGAEGDMK